MTDFQALWADHDYVSVHLNGPVWKHFIMNEHPLAGCAKVQPIQTQQTQRQVFEVVVRAFFLRPLPELETFVAAERQSARWPSMRLSGRWGDSSRYSGRGSGGLLCRQRRLRVRRGGVRGSCSVFVTAWFGNIPPLARASPCTSHDEGLEVPENFDAFGED